jgi:hypothetical protein
MGIPRQADIVVRMRIVGEINFNIVPVDHQERRAQIDP